MKSVSSYQASVPGHVVEAAHQVHKVVAVCQARRPQRVQPPVALLVCGQAVQATCARQKERREQHVARHESGPLESVREQAPGVCSRGGGIYKVGP